MLIWVADYLAQFESGFGVFKVKGFNLLPKPAHKINAVLIFI